MIELCDKCGPNVDPYDCWYCEEMYKISEIIHEKSKDDDIKEDKIMADGDCSNCKHIDECGVYEYNCIYGIYKQCPDEETIQRLINLAHVLETTIASIENIFEEKAIEDNDFDNGKFYIRNFCDIVNEETYNRFKELKLKED